MHSFVQSGVVAVCMLAALRYVSSLEPTALLLIGRTMLILRFVRGGTRPLYRRLKYGAEEPSSAVLLRPGMPVVLSPFI